MSVLRFLIGISQVKAILYVVFGDTLTIQHGEGTFANFKVFHMGDGPVMLAIGVPLI